MVLKIGDKVRFLNEKGEGYIVNFKNKLIAEVAIEDGFEIPVQVSELIKIADAADNKIVEETKKEDAITANIIADKKQALEGEQGVFVVFEPQGDVFSLVYNVYIVNNTHLQVLFSYSVRKSNVDNGMACGVLNSQSAQLLHTAKRTEIENWNNIFVQSVFHKQGEFRAIMPLDKRIIIKTQRLTQVNLMKNTPVLGFDTYHFPVIEMKDDMALDLEALQQTFSAKMLHDKAFIDNKKEKKAIERESNLRINPKNGYMEIDLHIEELLDDYEGMANGEIVQVQLKHCRKAIDKALVKRAGKITIIHGVGNGTLKSEVRNLLRSYKDIQYYDAPADKFGYGATEVLLK